MDCIARRVHTTALPGREVPMVPCLVLSVALVVAQEKLPMPAAAGSAACATAAPCGRQSVPEQLPPPEPVAPVGKAIPSAEPGTASSASGSAPYEVPSVLRFDGAASRPVPE